MLRSITVKNYILLEDSTIQFDDHFNTLTGETGAGKSILLGAISLLLGKRPPAHCIQSGKDEAIVSAEYSLEGESEPSQWLLERGFSLENEVVLRRICRREGRSSAYIQGQSVTLSELQTFSSLLFDLHSQHENQSLFLLPNQRRVLDGYAGLGDRLSDYEERYFQLKSLRQKREELKRKERETEEKRELYQFAVNEIEEMQLQEGEEEELESQISRLSSWHKRKESLTKLETPLLQSLSSLQEATGSLEELCLIDKKLTPERDRLLSLYYEMQDIVQSLPFEEANDVIREEDLQSQLDNLQQRGKVIQQLKKKYGDSIPEILAYKERVLSELKELARGDEESQQVIAEISRLEKEVGQIGDYLSVNRREAAVKLATPLTQRLSFLGMEGASFSIQVDEIKGESGNPAYTPSGKDRVEFLLSPHPGQPPLRLNEIASGGEISRVMLALKSLFADTHTDRTLIFDEIDTGVGGKIAVAVGSELKRLSKKNQIICITHLASIASQAQSHLRVVKERSQEKTIARIERIEGESRVQEIARMLSGESSEEHSLRHAQSLLNRGES